MTLDFVSINGIYDGTNNYNWAGITCEDDATVILKDGTKNTVKGFYHHNPGIFVPHDKTLIIKNEDNLYSNGFLDVSSNGQGAGIGGGYGILCGNITITTFVYSVTPTKGTGSKDAVDCIGKR